MKTGERADAINGGIPLVDALQNAKHRPAVVFDALVGFFCLVQARSADAIFVIWVASRVARLSCGLFVAVEGRTDDRQNS